MPKEENRFILSNELSYAPIRTEVDKIECNECGKHFYVDRRVIPEVCPFCETPLNLVQKVTTKIYECSMTGKLFTDDEASELSICQAFNDEKKRCIDCEKIVEVARYD